MGRWIDRADLLKDIGSRSSALGSADVRPAPHVSAAFAAWLRDWSESFAVSGLAYLLHEKAWSSSFWEGATARAPRRPRAIAAGRRALRLP
jgi:hypothetical protein